MTPIKLFITGIGGTAGRSLAKLAANDDFLVGGTIYQNFPINLKGTNRNGLIKYYQIDLKNLDNVKKAVKDFQPDVVVHLAGKVLGSSDKQIYNPAIYNENLTIFQNVLSSVKNIRPYPKFILSSGCLVYNKPTSYKYISEISSKNLPKIDRIKEPYRASKLDQEKLLINSGIEYIITRPTQFTGPGKIPGVIEFYIAKEILEILNGKKKTISVGNKLGEVDILDTRDVAQAYLTLIKKGATEEVYHISSGSPVTVEYLAKIFLEVADLNPHNFPINSTKKEQATYCRFSSAKLKNLGWKPYYNLKDTLTSYWEYFKNQERKYEIL